jgi:glutamate decarboxylase
MALHKQVGAEHADATVDIHPHHASSGASSVPRWKMDDGEIDPRAAYQIIHDELMLDGNSRLNLATFVTTWMEPEARLIIDECLDKNMIDKDEYPQTAELESRCVNMLAELWGATADGNATGCSTTGSSEACMLAGMALKRRWRARTGGDKPNLVMGANVQVCWEKFANYWEVEMRLVPVTEEALCLTPETAIAACDENTIGVVAVLGSTYDGRYEDVAGIAKALDDLAAGGGPDIPLHVDGASGGFIAPFIDPDLEWDFRIPRVVSINASGHKYGLVYPGVGWVVWRDADCLPEELIFHVDYLGGDMPTFALNFSRPGAQVAAQYYTLLRLGKEGFRRVQQTARDTAMWLSDQVSQVEPFELVSDGGELPVFAFKLKDGTPFTVYDVSEAIRSRGWTLPAYPCPEGAEHISILRVVVRNGFSRDLASLLVADLKRTVERLNGEHASEAERASFHH